jgi:hypothetical protein
MQHAIFRVFERRAYQTGAAHDGVGYLTALDLF